MAHLLVSDTSVLIDLERGNLLQATFKLPTPLAVPDVLYERELAPTNGGLLRTLGLRVLSLDAEGTSLAQGYISRTTALSVPDAFALALAKQGGHILVCGDRALRQLAESESVDCHGLLWVLDQLLESVLVPPAEMHQALAAISGHPRSRLPKHLVTTFLAKLGKQP
jgi:predicted nucleic acid-binding protein